MRTGSAIATSASRRRVDGVRANPSPAMRLPIAVAKTSAPGATRSNGVANESEAPVAVMPTMTTLPRSASGSRSSSEDLNCADALETSLGPVEAQRHVIAEVHRPRLPRDLDPVWTKDWLCPEPLGSSGEREGRGHAVRRFIDHRNIARHSALIRRNVGKPHLGRIADRVDRPENGGGLRRQGQIAWFGCCVRGTDRIEIANRRDDRRPGLERVGEVCVCIRIPRVEERDIDRDRSGMKTRQRPHEAGHHFARRRIASRFAERLIVNRDDDHARWRGTGAGKKEAPVEG